MMDGTLTERQDAILTFVVRYWGENQSMPTLRQIGKAVGIGSPNGVVGHLKRMAKNGVIELEETAARGIRVPMLSQAVKAAAERCVAEIMSRPTRAAVVRN
jgi:SOS-response transcriptional repressor LexA